MKQLILHVNSEPIIISSNKMTLDLKEDDRLFVEYRTNEFGSPPDVFFEDFQAEVKDVSLPNTHVYIYQTPEITYLSECFGFSLIRVALEEEVYQIIANVFATKTTANQARKMLEYLLNQGEEIVNVCFARSSISMGMMPGGFVDPNYLIASAEKYIEILQTSRLELINSMRQRLVPERVPFWKAQQSMYELDPHDVINNLDALSPSLYASDVFLRGRRYTLSGIDVTTVKATNDVFENQVLLGGIYSIRRKISGLLSTLQNLAENPAGTSLKEPYESFTRLKLILTTKVMINKCEDILHAVNELAKFLESHLDITFQGEILPRMTHFTKVSKIYRVLFVQLDEWYKLGQPKLDGILFLMKLQSLSKIYELYTLFHLIQFFISNNWNLISAIAHAELSEPVPSQVGFKKGSCSVTLMYEPKINVLSAESENLSLVDIHHSARSYRPYWNPDFVLKIEMHSQIRFIILDAKYSTQFSVRKYHIPELFDKYFMRTAVFYKDVRLISNAAITGIFAVYSLDNKHAKYISYQGLRDKGIENRSPLSKTPSIPMVGGFGLMTGNSELFESCLDHAISVTNKSMQIL